MNQITQVNPDLDPTSVEAWRQNRTQTIHLNNGVAVRVKLFDVLALGNDGCGVGNPLLASVFEMRQQAGEDADPETVGERIMTQDPDKVENLRQALNRMLIQVVLAPPLIEQGHEQGISVDEFTFEEKSFIYGEIMGGEQLDAAMTFREKPAPALDAGPDE